MVPTATKKPTTLRVLLERALETMDRRKVELRQLRMDKKKKPRT